eukprot:1159457-Amphidinium_carterae.1
MLRRTVLHYGWWKVWSDDSQEGQIELAMTGKQDPSLKAGCPTTIIGSAQAALHARDNKFDKVDYHGSLNDHTLISMNNTVNSKEVISVQASSSRRSSIKKVCVENRRQRFVIY